MVSASGRRSFKGEELERGGAERDPGPAGPAPARPVPPGSRGAQPPLPSLLPAELRRWGPARAAPGGTKRSRLIPPGPDAPRTTSSPDLILLFHFMFFPPKQAPIPRPSVQVPELRPLSICLPDPGSGSTRTFSKVKIYLPKLQQFSYFLTSGIYLAR